MTMNFHESQINELVRCNCGIPLLKRVALKALELLRFHKGQPVKMIMEYSGDTSEIRCQKCGYHHTFVHLDKSFQVGDDVAVIKMAHATV